jgi:hypothetical protein
VADTLLVLWINAQSCIIGESFPLVNDEETPPIEPLVSEFATFIPSLTTIPKTLTHTPEHHARRNKIPNSAWQGFIPGVTERGHT